MSLRIKAGGSLHPTTKDSFAQGDHNIYQDGKAVFKYAVSEMANAAEEIMKRNALDGNTIDYLVPHQANKRIVDATAKRLDLNQEKILMNIERYGNTTAATLPLLLHDYESKLKEGDKLIFAAFGGGFTWGAAHLTWAY
jgi:3-oxoacyl-[acyl-carrier-protein] synthase-3